MVKGHQSDLEERFNYALRLRESNDLDSSLKVFLDLNEDYPNHSAILGMIADLHWSLKNYGAAAQWAQKTIDVSPASELASLLLFHSLNAVGDEVGAFTEMKRFLEICNSKEYD